MQLDLFTHVLETYSDSTTPISNKDMYMQVAKKAGITQSDLHAKIPIGKAAAPRSTIKRKLRWYQQTLKHMGLIEQVDKGIWQLTEKQGKDLHKPLAGVKLLAFSTHLGIAIWGECREVFSSIKEPIHLCISSPPYMLRVARKYGNPSTEKEYIDFICASIEPIVTNLVPGGSIVLNVSNDIFEEGRPSRSLYLERLTLALHDRLGLSLMDRIQWVNYSKPPSPTYWSCINRYQLTSAYEPILWFTNDPTCIRSDNRRVLQPHSEQHLRMMKNGGCNRNAVYGDGAYHLRPHSFGKQTPGKIPRNIIEKGHRCPDSTLVRNLAKDLGLPPHGAMFPSSIVEFFINFTTEPDDLVVDLFAGSTKVGWKAEEASRRWIVCEWMLEYIRSGAEFFKEKKAEGLFINPLLLSVGT